MKVELGHLLGRFLPQEIQEIGNRLEIRPKSLEQLIDVVEKQEIRWLVINVRPDFGKNLLNGNVIYDGVIFTETPAGRHVIFKKKLLEVTRLDEISKRFIRVVTLARSERIREKLPDVNMIICDVGGGIFRLDDYREFLQQLGYNLTPQEQPL